MDVWADKIAKTNNFAFIGIANMLKIIVFASLLKGSSTELTQSTNITFRWRKQDTNTYVCATFENIVLECPLFFM